MIFAYLFVWTNPRNIITRGIYKSSKFQYRPFLRKFISKICFYKALKIFLNTV